MNQGLHLKSATESSMKQDKRPRQKGPTIQELLGYRKGGRWLSAAERKKVMAGFKRHCLAKQMRCLATSYETNSSPMRFKCQICKRVWKSDFAHIQQGGGCRKCNHDKGCERFRLDVKSLDEEAKKRGWELLSRNYKNNTQTLQWRCGNGHLFPKRWGDVQRGQGCPDCSKGRPTSFGEEVCRQYLQRLFRRDFRPLEGASWLTPPGDRARSLRLDGYNKSLGLAFEHHGLQHGRKASKTSSSKFGRNSAAVLRGIRQRDALKKKLCSARGVNLVIIWEVGSKQSPQAALEEIVRQVTAMGYKVPKNWKGLRLNLRALYSPRLIDPYKQLKSAAEEKDGKVISRSFEGWH